MMQITPTVKQLLILNVIFFVGANFVPQAYDFLALYYFENEKFQFWQPLTHMFMHARFPNISHILFNMFALYSFGSALEQFWGGKKFLFFYISCGLGAALLQMGINHWEIQQLLSDAQYLNLSHSELHQIFNVQFADGNFYRSELFEQAIRPILQKSGKLQDLNQEGFHALFQAAVASKSTMVGASGAIYGLLVAFAFLFPNAELALLFIPIPIKAKYFVPGLLAIDLFLGLSGKSIFGSGGSSIAHFAHIGGAIVGFLMMWYWKKNQFNNNRWD